MFDDTDSGVPPESSEDRLADTGAVVDGSDMTSAEALLRESQSHYRDLFGHAPLAIMILDFSEIRQCVERLKREHISDFEEYCEGNPVEVRECMAAMRLVDANDAALELYGAGSCEQLVASRDEPPTPGMVETVRRVMNAIAEGKNEDTFESRSRKLNGESIDVLIRWAVAVGHETDFSRVFMFVVDITPIRTSLAEAKRYETRFKSIFESTPLGLRLYRLEDDGRLILEAVNASADKLLHISHADLIGLTIEEAFPSTVGTPIPDTFRRVARTGEPWQTEQFSYHDDRISGAFAVYAFRTEPNTVAVMFEDITTRRQQEEQLEQYRVQLEGMVEDTTRELARASAERDAVTDIAVRLVEARDPYTAGHQRRVTELVRAICGKLGLCEEEAGDITIAAQLHDIGKVSVPSDILSKPGALTRTEYLLVQDHPETAFQILETAKLGVGVAHTARQHHERMDGSGYPQGLKGDQILMGARIIAVADVVEAMASHRPYRPSLGISAALDEIKRGRATLFDADVVDCCLALFAAGFTFSDDNG